PFVRDLSELEEEMKDLKRIKNRETELKIDRIEGGLRIRIDGDRIFDPGSDRVLPEFQPMIKEMAQILSGYPNELIVEGHTDQAFTGSSRFSEGYELAGAMAQAVAQGLITEGRLAPGKIGVASYGSTQPLESNQSVTGRARNRRVDILILEHKN
ncbi:MAG: OmpA family protein, partial [Planctomycetes bacterium]|nr:OmpA family protein [Planctomycetota bacterium]